MLFKKPARYRHDLLVGSPKPVRRKPVLNVKARLSSQRQWRNRQVLVLMAALTCLISGALIFWMLAGKLFYNNPRFVIRRLDIEAGQNITRELIKKYTGLAEGTNVFAVNIRAARENFMSRFPNVKRMEITRTLPSIVSVKVTERVPIAKLGYSGNLCIDEEGYIFGQRDRVRNLPLITGYDSGDIKPGNRIDGPALAALQLLNVSLANGGGLMIEAVNLHGPRQLELRVVYDDVTWKGRMAWPEMGKPSRDSEAQLTEKLAMMRTVFKTRPSRQDGSFSAMGSDVEVE